MAEWWVYLINKDGKLYTGITTDLGNRMRQHGKKRPLYSEGPMSREEAVKREKIIKGRSRKKKLELIRKETSRRL